MLSAKDLGQFEKVCIQIGNDVADDEGFVPIRNLLSRFQARLMLRPLLVEAMIAAQEAGRWAVLVDSETYNLGESAINAERYGQPLPSRFRNTVAHELVHSLAFRPSEFGIRLQHSGDTTKKAQSALVEIIERQTDRLSPLLLWPEKALGEVVDSQTRSLSVDAFATLRRNLGISRYVLINRLRLLPLTDVNRHRPGLSNIAIGVGEWTPSGAVLRKWPLFLNLRRNIVPTFLLKLLRQDRLPAEVAIPASSVACGGHSDRVVFDTTAGTPAYADSDKMRVEFSVEPIVRSAPSSSFLFVVKPAL